MSSLLSSHCGPSQSPAEVLTSCRLHLLEYSPENVQLVRFSHRMLQGLSLHSSLYAAWQGVTGLCIMSCITMQHASLSVMRRDDAVFHDSFLNLFPEYWQKVPKEFQFVFLGHVYWGSVWDDAIVHLGPRTSPW